MKILNSYKISYNNNHSYSSTAKNNNEHGEYYNNALTSYPKEYYLISFNGRKKERRFIKKDILEKELKPHIKSNDTYGILKTLNIECEKRPDGKITVLDMKLPYDLLLDRRSINYLEDLGINSQKLMDDVTEIKGDADFSIMKNLKKFKSLEKIYGNALFNIKNRILDFIFSNC